MLRQASKPLRPIGAEWHAKIFDNAIVGFILNHLEQFRPKGRSSSEITLSWKSLG